MTVSKLSFFLTLREETLELLWMDVWKYKLQIQQEFKISCKIELNIKRRKYNIVTYVLKKHIEEKLILFNHVWILFHTYLKRSYDHRILNRL